MHKSTLSAIAAILLVAGAGLIMAQNAAAPAAAAASAEVKVGLAIEKIEITGESSTFKVPAGTKIYVWTKVTGAADSKINIVYLKGDKEITTRELPVPSSPYRTNAYKTFRDGDSGEWTAKVMSADGKELGKASFTVEITK